MKVAQSVKVILAPVQNVLLHISILSNIVTIYQRMGEYKEALKYSLEIIEKSKQALGANQYVSVLSNIGELYRKLGRYEESLKFHKECHSIRLTVLK